MERFKEFIEGTMLILMWILVWAFATMIFAGLIIFLFMLGGIFGYIIGGFVILFYIIGLIWIILGLIEEWGN